MSRCIKPPSLLLSLKNGGKLSHRARAVQNQHLLELCGCLKTRSFALRAVSKMGGIAGSCMGRDSERIATYCRIKRMGELKVCLRLRGLGKRARKKRGAGRGGIKPPPSSSLLSLLLHLLSSLRNGSSLREWRTRCPLLCSKGRIYSAMLLLRIATRWSYGRECWRERCTRYVYSGSLGKSIWVCKQM